jgi:hypothetical protein
VADVELCVTRRRSTHRFHLDRWPLTLIGRLNRHSGWFKLRFWSLKSKFCCDQIPIFKNRIKNMLMVTLSCLSCLLLESQF